MVRGAALALGLPAIAVALYLAVYWQYRLVAESIPTTASWRQVLRVLRLELNGHKAALPPGKASITVAGPVWISLYHRGDVLFRWRGSDQTLAEMLRQALTSLAADQQVQQLPKSERKHTRWRVDVAVGRSPVVTGVPFLFAKSFVPGLDGVGLQIGDRAAYLLPVDLYQRQWMASYQPFYFMQEFRTGLELRSVVDDLAAQLALSREQWRRSRRRFFRFRVQSFAEDAQHRRALNSRLARVLPTQPLSRAQAEAAGIRAARFLMRRQRSDGRFVYIYHPLSPRQSPDRISRGDYNLPRHAGTTWFLATALSKLAIEGLTLSTRRAAQYLAKHAVPPSCRGDTFACVGSEARAGLGASALTLVALADYEMSTGDTRFAALVDRLGRFLLHMQRKNGDFCHVYLPRTGQKQCNDVLLYYSGEAALALAKLWQRNRDPTLLPHIERALDFLTDTKYRFFLGQFFISEDHWTCIAADAAKQAVTKLGYARFCRAFADLNRKVQIGRSFGQLGHLAGAFSITPFFLPHNTPVGSRTEANIATYRLLRHHGIEAPLVRDTILAAARYLVAQQIGPQNDYLYQAGDAAHGAITQTPARASVRIDYVQHAAAAILGALPLLL